MRLMHLIPLIGLLSGCAVFTQPYVVPASGPTAKLRIVNGAQRDLEISFYDQSDHCVGRRSLKKLKNGEEVTTVVYAERDLTFQLYQTERADGRFCLKNIRFRPSEGGSYVFETRQSANSCQWHMSQESESGLPSPVPIRGIAWSRGVTEGGSWCNE